jgi:hypothetical protein
MSSCSVSGSSNASTYLQSLLKSDKSKSASGGDQVQSLLAAFYPNGLPGASDAGTDSSATTASITQPPSGSTSGLSFSPDTMSQLISAQSGLGNAHTQSLFANMDANSDGKVSQSEFENVFGSDADKSKVDGLFAALDSDSDGSVSGTEFASAVKGGSGHHRHHGGGGGGGLQGLLSGTDAAGATTNTVTAPDGSTTTTIKYADGSSISSTTAALNSSAGGGGNAGARSSALEQLIRQQAQIIASVAGNLATTLATI